MKAHVRAAAFALLGMMGTACQPAEPVSSVTVDTLPGGAVRVTNSGGGQWGADGGWALSHVLTLGDDPADSLAQFGQIWDFTADDHGNLYVLDRQAEAVLVFSPDGDFVRRIGRPGQGPGEFQFPTGLAWDPQGRLWVANVGLGRFEVFDTAGSHVSSHVRRALGFGYPWGGVFLESGALADPTSIRRSAEGESESVVFIQHDPASSAAPVDTVSLPFFQKATWTVQQGRGRLVAGIPFTPDLRWQMDRAGRLWVAVNDEYSIHQVDWAGDTTRVIGRAVDPMPVGAAEVDAQLALFERSNPDFRTLVDLDLIPQHKPAFDVFFFDDLDHLWVARTRGNDLYPGGFDNTFDVFDPGGRLLGSVQAEVSTVPPPRVIGDLLIGVSRDALETQRLVVHRIERR